MDIEVILARILEHPIDGVQRRLIGGRELGLQCDRIARGFERAVVAGGQSGTDGHRTRNPGGAGVDVHPDQGDVRGERGMSEEVHRAADDFPRAIAHNMNDYVSDALGIDGDRRGLVGRRKNRSEERDIGSLRIERGSAQQQEDSGFLQRQLRDETDC